MTTLTNLEVVAQLGWTAQLMYNSTGGRVPKFWRPPYGDSDNRVRAIAQEVFGLTTVIWNQDTEDWSIPTDGTTAKIIAQNFQKWLTGPKTPGLIILEHELGDYTVDAFIAAWPVIKANNWNIGSLAQVIGSGQAYQNAANGSSPVTPATIIPGDDAAFATTSTSTSTSAPSAGSSANQGTKATTTLTGNNLGTSQTPTKSSGALSQVQNIGLSWTLLTTLFLAASMI